MISTLFDTMNKWRQFPNWQIDSRASIFFGLFLNEILSIKGINDICGIVPEFPVRHGDIYKGIRSNRSSTIDYVAFTPTTAYLIELSIDCDPRKEKHRKHIELAQHVGIETLLGGLLSIYRATHFPDKYQTLLNELVAMGWMELVGEGEYRVPTVSRKTNKLRIQASPSGGIESGIITFNEIAAEAPIDCEIGKQFKEALKEWGTAYSLAV
ncbi:MAG: hypothetical protein OCC49_12865 [Fibrobacterales bacterium]